MNPIGLYLEPHSALHVVLMFAYILATGAWLTKVKPKGVLHVTDSARVAHQFGGHMMAVWAGVSWLVVDDVHRSILIAGTWCLPTWIYPLAGGRGTPIWRWLPT